MKSQCVLQSGSLQMVAWLDAEDIKPGYRVTLKDSEEPERWWTIIEIGKPREKGAFHDAHEAKDWYKKDFLGKLSGLQIK